MRATTSILRLRNCFLKNNPNMRLSSLSFALFVVLTGLLELASASHAAEGMKKFATKAAEVIKKTKATIEKKGLQSGLKEYEAAVIALRAEFPDNPKPWAMLLEVAINLDYQDEKLKPNRKMPGPEDKEIAVINHVQKLLTEINKAPAAYSTTKERARQELARLARLGKPLTLEFDALMLDLKSGLPRQEPFLIDSHRGKVVLVHFWSTQSGPCIADLPRLKQARTKHANDLVAVGISLDENSARFRRFLKEKRMGWPQHFDGRGWDNRIAVEFGVTSIPTQWLIDRQGNLRALNARHGLEEKIKVLVEEKPSANINESNATKPATKTPSPKGN